VLSTPQVSRRVGHDVGANARVTRLGTGTYQVAGSKGDFILRFPRDEAHLAMLKREEAIQRGLRARVTVIIPDTTVIADLDPSPAFAIHRMIPGQPLTSDCYAHLSPATRDRLVADLANFFRETHSVPLEVACEWLGIPFAGARTVAELAATQGKPTWFGPAAVAEMRPGLVPLLDDHQMALFEDTARRCEALETDSRLLVFGHGDLHGYNVAMADDDLGPRFAGAFDLGCAGILDVHEDFFRLSLVSEDLLERVIEAYQRLPGQWRALRWDRIAIYYRAFLFYLMAELPGETLGHLKALLQSHLEYQSLTLRVTRSH